ncbi:MAG: hypothetical protein HRU35_02350 [Rickettsiaceae bacterium]|nr:hypothetical protein [Rickettsiaceae bacterium]
MFPQAEKLINQLSSDRNSLIKQQNTLLESEKHYNEFSHKIEENSINSTADNITASANKIADKITTSVNNDKITELGNELEKICTQELEIYNTKKQIDQGFESHFREYHDNISQNKQATKLNEKLDIANISKKMQIRVKSEKEKIEIAAKDYEGNDLKGHLKFAIGSLDFNDKWWQKQQQAIKETILSTNELEDIHEKGQKIIELYETVKNTPNENIKDPKYKPLRQAYNIYTNHIQKEQDIDGQNKQFFLNAYNKFANPHTVEQKETKENLIAQWNTLEQAAKKMNLDNIQAVANFQKKELGTISSSKIDGHKEPNEKALKAQYESAFSSLKKSGTELFKQIESSQDTVNDIIKGVLSKEIKENFQEKFDNIYAMSEVIKENIQDYQVANAKLDQLSEQLPELDQNIDALKEQQQNLVSQLQELQELGEQVEEQQQSKSSDQQKMSKEDYKKWQEKWGKVVKQFEKSLQLEPAPDIQQQEQQSKPMVTPPVPDDAIKNKNEPFNKIDEKDEVLTIAPNGDIIPEGKEKEYLEKSGLTDNKDLKDIDKKPKPIPPIQEPNFENEYTYQSPPDDIEKIDEVHQEEINKVDQIQPKGLPTIDTSKYDLDKDGNPLSPEQQKISDVLKAAMEKAVDKPWLIDIPDRAKQFFNDEIFNKLNDTLSNKEILDLKKEINPQIDEDWDNKVSSTVGKFKAWVYKMDKKYNIGIYGTKSKVTGQIREAMKKDINNLIKENIENKLLTDAQKKVIKTDNSAQQPYNPTHVQNINKGTGQDGPSVGG